MDVALIGWSRAQFALTAMYHWVFVPLTLGLGLLMCIYSTYYYKTGDEKWKSTTRFWQKLFAINFAVGIATGLILEFEFGTNWSNYSYFVGDIFGAPLAIEGIVAFFLEATFFAVVFFGWDRVSKKFHLASTWIAVFGATLSAWWILVANSWMQYPVGMHFNPETARNEMNDFIAVAFSPVAINKFLHTVLSCWVLGSAFVVGLSSWYLLRKRHIDFSIRSIKIAAIVGLTATVLTALTGHYSGQKVARHQPMKLAAMEGLYNGKNKADIEGFGVLKSDKVYNDGKDPFVFKIDVPIPGFLSFMSFDDFNSFVPGIQDIIDGYTLSDGTVYPSYEEKAAQGKLAQQALRDYRQAMKDNDEEAKIINKAVLDENIKYFGYGFFNSPEETIPPVALTFYTFHIMVALGLFFIAFFAIVWYLNKKGTLQKVKWLLWLGVISIPLAYITSQSGWIVAEVGRQPWSIQDVLPLSHSVSNIPVANVKTTFFIFLGIFTIFLIADIGIMINTIRKGPEAVDESKGY